ncbi:MAG: nucleotidyltransferase family protein [Nitrososphaerota archaeon]|nr:nucleotidyltransferase family protein [Nitrososphaerota archaeon]
MGKGTQAAILCGGRGERLKPLTDYFQKVMIPIGPKKLPLLAYIIALVKHHGIEDIALLTGYRSEDIRHYFGDGKQHGVRLSYSKDENGVSGSLNAVAHALRNEAIDSDELLIYYGDILTDLDITALLETHRRTGADVTLVLDKGYTLPVGVAELNGDMVSSFKEKPRVDLTVTTGPMVVGPNAMELMKSLASKERPDLMTDFVPEMLKRGGKVAAFYNQKEWLDVGTLTNFEKLNQKLARHPLNHLV